MLKGGTDASDAARPASHGQTPANALATPTVASVPAREPGRLPRRAFAAVVVVVLMTGLSPVPVPVAFDHQDKLHHVAGFALLVLTARLAFPGLASRPLAFGCLSLALLIELAQGLMVLRSASAVDMLANVAGIGLGLALAILLKLRS